MPKKPATQDEAVAEAFVAGTLPEEDRRAPEGEVPFVGAVTLDPPGGFYFTDEMDRLLSLVEFETGYAQKHALYDLKVLLGRPAVRP